jgi:hypothetical protein
MSWCFVLVVFGSRSVPHCGYDVMRYPATPTTVMGSEDAVVQMCGGDAAELRASSSFPGWQQIEKLAASAAAQQRLHVPTQRMLCAHSYTVKTGKRVEPR